MRPEFVVLDWYGTLAAPSHEDVWTRMPEIVARAGGTPDAEALGAWERTPAEHPEHSASEERYRAWQEERLRALLQACAVPHSRQPALLAEISARRYGREFAVFPDVPPVLAALRERGLRLGLFSNWDWDLQRHLERNRIHACFEFVICSASFGWRKPHPRMFAEVARRAAVPAGRILVVGDDWGLDVEGAEAAGFAAAHVARAGCGVGRHGEVPCLSDLRGLLPLLGGAR